MIASGCTDDDDGVATVPKSLLCNERRFSLTAAADDTDDVQPAEQVCKYKTRGSFVKSSLAESSIDLVSRLLGSTMAELLLPGEVEVGTMISWGGTYRDDQKINPTESGFVTIDCGAYRSAGLRIDGDVVQTGVRRCCGS